MTCARRKLLSRDQRQATILQGAATAFATKGFAATGMEAVAAASGITKEIVYRHFASKEELYREVLDSTVQILQAEFAWASLEIQSAPACEPCSPSVAPTRMRSASSWCIPPASQSSRIGCPRRSHPRDQTGCCSVEDTLILSSAVGRSRWRHRTPGMRCSPGLMSVTLVAMRSSHSAASPA